MALSDSEVLRRLASVADELKRAEAQTAYGRHTLDAAALALERLAAAIPKHHADQAITRLSEPDPPDDDRNG